MKRHIQFFSLLLALLSVVSLCACGGKAAGGAEDGSLVMEDGEDVGLEQAKVTIANMTGHDAVQLLARASGSDDWSDNILSQDYLHTNKAVEITYNVGKAELYDLRLVFEDGSCRDFTGLDFDNAKSTIYLGPGEADTAESSTQA